MKYVLLVVACIVIGCGGGSHKAHIPTAYMVVVNDASSVHNIVWIQWLTTGYVAVDIAPGDSSAPIHLNPFTTYYVMVMASCGQCYYATITTGDDGTTFWLYVYDPS